MPRHQRLPSPRSAPTPLAGVPGSAPDPHHRRRDTLHYRVSTSFNSVTRQTMAPRAGAGRWPVPSPERILVAEDDADIRGLVAVVLSDAGFRVTCANDGKEGWDALCADHFDLLVTDHDMPNLTGLELLCRIRAGRANLPVVLISGSMPLGEPDLFRCLAPGVALEKPFSLKVLLRTIQRLLAPVPSRSGNPTGQTPLASARAPTLPGDARAGRRTARPSPPPRAGLFTHLPRR